MDKYEKKTENISGHLSNLGTIRRYGVKMRLDFYVTKIPHIPPFCFYVLDIGSPLQSGIGTV
ncbi:MAG: hypothetical protein ACXQTY_01100, partial [Candidatus Methanogasteraceae archaeon]